MLTVVTGAAGFIGSRLAEALNRRGISEILAVDDLENAEQVGNLARLEIEDYLDKRDFLERLAAGQFEGAIEAVFHQGACSDTLHTDGRYLLQNNYRYSRTLLDWCQEEKVPFLYASSAAVYGAGRAFREERACEAPLNAYAYSKFLFDQYVRRRLPGRAAQIAGLRYFNVYGPNETHKGRMASVAFHAYRQLAADGRVKLFAGYDGFPDGGQKRDFIHVDDAVNVNLWLLEQRDVSGIYNCGTGRAQTFNQLAAEVINAVRGSNASAAELAERKLIEYIPFPQPLAGKYQSFTEAELSRLRLAGYHGDFAPVEQGVAAYVRHLRQA